MYAEFLSKKLGDAGAEEGCTLSIETSGKSYKGVLMPHHEFSGEDIVILKVKSGYNIGIRIDESAEIEVVSKPVERVKPESAEETKEGLKTIVLIGTGGTIAS